MSEDSKAIEKVESQAIIERPGLTEGDLEHAEKQIGLFNRAKVLAIKATHEDDWSDQSGHPYPEASACQKIAGVFGITILPEIEVLAEMGEDTLGQFVRYTAKGAAQWKGRIYSNIGTASSRDDFFGKRTRKDENGKVVYKDGKAEKFFLPLAEVDVESVRKKAVTNLQGRLIRGLLGLKFTWEDLKNAGLNTEKVKSIQRERGARGGTSKAAETKDTADLRAKIASMLMEMSNGDIEKAKAKMIQLTSWTNKEGRHIEGKSSTQALSSKQLPVVYRQIKKVYEEFLAGQEGGQDVSDS